MTSVTGVVALVLVFVAGPYRTVQRRWPRIWLHPFPEWAHANLSLLALAAVMVHVSLRLNKVGLNLDWVATLLFLTAFISGLYGLYLAAGPTHRRRWLRVHLWLNWIFSAAIALHIIQTSLGLAGVALVALAYVGWRYRLTGGRRLGRIDWPFERPLVDRRRSTARKVARWALIPALLVAATAGPVASGLIVSALAG